MDVEITEVAPGVWHARAKHVGWVLVTEGDEVTLVDTGFPRDRDRVVRSLERIHRTPAAVAAVVLTHAHPDHVGSAEHFRTELAKPVWAHELEAPNATGERIEQVATRELLKRVWRPDVFVWLVEAMRLGALNVRRVGALSMFTDRPLDLPGRPVVVHTPGHTSGHCALYLPAPGALLAGDAFMTQHAVARTTGPQLMPAFFDHDHAQARASLERLRGLDAGVVVPGHGPVFTGTPDEAVTAVLTAPQPRQRRPAGRG